MSHAKNAGLGFYNDVLHYFDNAARYTKHDKGLLEQIAGMSDKITLKTDGQDQRVPSFAIAREDGQQHLRFAATLRFGSQQNRRFIQLMSSWIF